MPALFAAIGVFLAQIAGPLTARVLAALGLGVISFTGVDMAVTGVVNQVKSSFSGVPADIINVATIAGFDKFLSLVISAYVGVVSVRALLGAFRRIGFLSDTGEG